MPVLVFAAPFFTDNAKRFLRALLDLPDTRVALVSQDPIEWLPHELRGRLATHVRIENGLDADHLARAVTRVTEEIGAPHRLLSIMEQIQVQLAEVRERLGGIPGMRAEIAHRFRDKRRMKELLREAGVPVARHTLASTEAEAIAFAHEVGFPVVVKPPAGAASQATFRVDDPATLREALSRATHEGGGAALVEEFVKGEEHSFDAFVLHGKVVFHSISRYLPTPLDVMQNPWIQWVVVLPRELEAPEFDAIRDVGARTLEVLGLETGMCHLEWFKRGDGSVVVSEVAARPPGAQIPIMISRAHEVDCLHAWARLMAFDTFEAFPPRKYAVGAAYLRGQGEGRVRDVHGVEAILHDLGPWITDVRIPEPGEPKAASYEGEGHIIVRHPETRVVTDALWHVISTVRVELG